MFYCYDTYYNYESKDLYFVGIKMFNNTNHIKNIFLKEYTNIKVKKTTP